MKTRKRFNPNDAPEGYVAVRAHGAFCVENPLENHLENPDNACAFFGLDCANLTGEHFCNAGTRPDGFNAIYVRKPKARKRR